MSVKLLTEHHLEFLSLKGGLTGSSESTILSNCHIDGNHTSQFNYIYLPLPKGRGHIVLGADPNSIGSGAGMICAQDIS